MVFDDNGYNCVFVYVGDKSIIGMLVEKVGFFGGKLYVIYFENISDEINNGGSLVVGDIVFFMVVFLGEDFFGVDGLGVVLRSCFFFVNNLNLFVDFKNIKFDCFEDGVWDFKNFYIFYFVVIVVFSVFG